MEFNQIFKILKARQRIIIQTVLIIVATAMLFSFFQKPVYEATSTILLKEKDMGASMLFGSLGSQLSAQPERSLQTQIKLLTIRPTLQKVIDKLKLNIEPIDLEQKIKIKPEGNANLLTVSVRDESAYKAQKIANVLVQEYLTSSRQTTTNELTRARQEVGKKIKDTEDDIMTLAREVEKRSGKVPDDLRAKMDMASGIYVMLSEKHEQLRISEKLRTNEGILISPAIVPVEPVLPKPLQTAVLSLIGGLMVGIAFAFAADQLDNTIKTIEDAEDIYGLPVIGQIPHQDTLIRDTEKIAVIGRPKSLSAEAYRAIRTNIQYFNVEKHIKTIMITSSNPQEGKSISSVNMAAAFAQTGKNVILMNCDLRRPTVHEYLGVGNSVGLSNYLASYIDSPDEIIKETKTQGLYMIASGPVPPNPSELLGSRKMEKLISELRDKFDYIILDSAPILAVTDATVLARFMDGVIIISDYTKTTKEHGQKIRSALEKTGVRLLGVILNNIPGSIAYNSYDNYSYIESDKKSSVRFSKITLAAALVSIPAIAYAVLSFVRR